MKAITNFLLFMSKTDKDIIQYCSRAARSTRAALGLFVVITAILAFISGTYAISTIFQQVDMVSGETFLATRDLLISIFVGCLYAVIIANIDREIVSSSSKLSVLVRLILAIIIGIVLAVPLELKLMEGRINKKLISMSDVENNSAKEIKEESKRMLATQRTELINELKSEKMEINKWSERMHAEIGGIELAGCSGKKGSGPMYLDAQRNLMLHQNNLDQIEKMLESSENSYQGIVNDIENEYEQSFRSQSFDFSSKMEALNFLKRESKTINMTAWGIMLMLIILELTPALIKLINSLEKKTEYDLLMEARLGINNTSVSVYANNAVNEIEKDVNKASYDYVVNLKNLVKV